MNAKQLTEIMLTLSAAYPHMNVTAQTTAVYRRCLADMPFDLAQAAVLQAISSSKFFPTVAELREAAAKLTATDAMLTAGEAWAEVLRAVQTYHYYGKPEWSSELVRKAVEAIGWQTICASEQIGVERAHFLRIYDQLAEREGERMRMLPEVRRLADRLSADRAMQPIGKLLASGEGECVT